MDNKKRINKTNYIFLVVLFFISCYLVFFPTLSKADPTIPPAIPSTVIDPARIKEKLKTDESSVSLTKYPGIAKEINKLPLTTAEDNSKDVHFKLSQINLTGVTVYKKNVLLKYYKKYLGKKISFKELQGIASAITKHYRQDGYVISRALIPVQEVKSGIVTIKVVEGYIEEIYIEGGTTKLRALVEKYAKKIKRMKPLKIDTLERYMLILDDLLGVEVKTVLSPAVASVGAADLILIIEQQRFMGELSYDNRGSLYMGPDQVTAAISVSDVITGGDNISLQMLAAPINFELGYLQLGYSLPLGTNGWRLNVEGSLTETRPGFILEPFDLIGRSKNASVELEYPLLRTRDKNLWLHSKLDFLDSYTRSDDFIWFQDRIYSFRFGLSYDFIDKLLGGNIFDLEVSHGLTKSPLEPLIPLSRNHGRSDYTKANVSLSRFQVLGTRLLLLAAISGQYSFNSPLLSAEEFSFGGEQFGRAYDASEITGDMGVVGKLELRMNTYPNKLLLEQIQYYVFYDLGAVWNIGEVDSMQQPVKDSGSDLGGGLRIIFNKHFYGSIEAAKPLTRKVDTQVATDKSGRDWRIYCELGLKI
jgi:hemolysin activation/secretion protein